VLCAYSALRSGAGLATLLIPQGAKTESDVIPEIMRMSLSSPLNTQALERITALVIGSGVSQSRYDIANEILNYAVRNSKSVVVDAGALPLLSALQWPTSTQSQLVATPHPGEAARLLSTTASDVEGDRIKTANSLLQLSAQWPAYTTWILKGACPIIAHKEHGVVVCEGGVSTLSVGGSGDVLAGLCGALFAQTQSGFSAALLGVSAHLQAGRLLMQGYSRGYLAHEIADALPQVLFKTGHK
jgi:NAD(P)H-hydrate epimerase